MGKTRSAAGGAGAWGASGRRALVRPPARAGGAGFTMIEVVIALGVVLLTVAVLSRSVVSGARLSDTTRESALAHEAARRVLEELAATPFDEVFARYDADPADDPASGVSPGAAFDVPGLEAPPGDADGLPGAVLFPTVVGVGGIELREDVDDPWLGMPRDLNGDDPLVFDSADHSGDYVILPVRVRVEWIRADGERRRLDIGTLLAER